jgi:hypothetical protein
MADWHRSIGTFINASPGAVKKAEAEEWAKAKYPRVHEKLVELGQTARVGGNIFNIDRSAPA